MRSWKPIYADRPEYGGPDVEADLSSHRQPRESSGTPPGRHIDRARYFYDRHFSDVDLPGFLG
jgi:hypothetical protein